MNPQKVANCAVLGDGTSANDSAHVSKITPQQLKKREYANDPMYKTEVDSGLGPKREAATTAARRGGNVRPLDGGFAAK
jgi:hypothetical protein